jgi:hypothetical protein
VELSVRLIGPEREYRSGVITTWRGPLVRPEGAGILLASFSSPADAPKGVPLRLQLEVLKPVPGFDERYGRTEMFVVLMTDH